MNLSQRRLAAYCRPTNGVHRPTGACYIHHMRSTLRSFFLCLLIVSLPMQSIAGVARVACGMMHHASVLQGGEPGPAAMAAMADDDMHDVALADAGPTAQTSSDEDCASGAGTHERSSCGTCASCSIGAYAPPPVIVFTAIEGPANGLQQFSPSPFSGPVPARIERPPRTGTPSAV
jgi:hypothetical protein